MKASSLFAWSTLALTSVAAPAWASALPTEQKTFTTSIPWQSFIADFNADGISGDMSGRVPVHPFNPKLGVFQGSVIVATFQGYPFRAKFEVQGAAPSVTFSEDLGVDLNLIVNGNLANTDTVGPLHLAGSCSGPSGFILDCSAVDKFTSFADASGPIANPYPNAVVQFGYTLHITNEQCSANGSACIQGGTSITDLKNLNDPKWRAQVEVTYNYIPPPSPNPPP